MINRYSHYYTCIYKQTLKVAWAGNLNELFDSGTSTFKSCFYSHYLSYISTCTWVI